MTKLGSGVMKTTDVARDLQDTCPAGRGAGSVRREINSEGTKRTKRDDRSPL